MIIDIMNKSVRETTLEHIRRVNELMKESAVIILNRGSKHDESKLSEPEAFGFESLGNDFRKFKYGSEEYYKKVNDPRFQEAVKHHHMVNRHHIEHFKNGIKDMNLFDIIEMICDWKAASERQENSVFEEHIQVNFYRFGIPDEYKNMIINTAKALGFINL